MHAFMSSMSKDMPNSNEQPCYIKVMCTRQLSFQQPSVHGNTCYKQLPMRKSCTTGGIALQSLIQDGLDSGVVGILDDGLNGHRRADCIHNNDVSLIFWAVSFFLVIRPRLFSRSSANTADETDATNGKCEFR